MNMYKTIDRRELFALLTAGVLIPRWLSSQGQEPEFSALDQIEFFVSNVERSRDFYVRIFGNTLRNRGAKRYLKLGSAYMAFEPPRGNNAEIRVDHFSASIKRLDMPKLHSILAERGVAYQDYRSGRDTGVNDPDGTRLQLSPEDGWSLLKGSRLLKWPVLPSSAIRTDC
jgi:catechol 2,3-dioxygenase-like lactoylglutathione lyase family enzyme